MSPDPEPPVRLNEREQTPPPGGSNGSSGSARARRGGRPPRVALFRIIVVGLSAAGVLAALVLSAAGHGTIALRVLAGDVLALVVALLLVS